MFFAIIAADKPGVEALRAEMKERHRKHLDTGACGVTVLQSGPLLCSDGREQGSLIIVRAIRLGDVREFVASDPYNLAGLFATIDVRAWEWRRGNPYL